MLPSSPKEVQALSQAACPDIWALSCVMLCCFATYTASFSCHLSCAIRTQARPGTGHNLTMPLLHSPPTPWCGRQMRLTMSTILAKFTSKVKVRVDPPSSLLTPDVAARWPAGPTNVHRRSWVIQRKSKLLSSLWMMCQPSPQMLKVDIRQAWTRD